MISGSWIDQIYQESHLASGWSSQVILEKIVKDLAPACGLPELEYAHDRRPCNSATMVLDAWGIQSDDSLGNIGGAPASVLHLVGFIDRDATKDDQLSLEKCGDAIRGMAWFYTRSVRKETPLYELTSPSEPSYNAARFLYEEQETFQHIQFTLISTLNGNEEALQRVAQVALANEGLAEISSIDVWTLNRIERLHSANGTQELLVLDLSELDEGAAPGQQPAPHPVVESGMDGGWEVYSTVLTGHQIARFYSRHRQRLLNENVRAFLQFSTKTNKSILATIKNDPVKFVSYNNGISIVARRAVKSMSCAEACCAQREVLFSDYCQENCCGKIPQFDRQRDVQALWSLEDAQIVNGGQTTAAIFHASRDSEVRRKGSLSQVRVPVKITVVPGTSDDREDAIALIAKYANTQNAIKAGDLESNNAYFRRLEVAAGLALAPAGPRTGTTWVFERVRGRFAETAQLEGVDWLRSHPADQRVDKYLLADVMNCVSGRPYEAQLGGDALFARYLRWLRTESGAGPKRVGGPERLQFFEQLNVEASNLDALSAEWTGVVSSVLVRRELERLFVSMEGWIRSISHRYVLALAYRTFGPQWLAIWDRQSVEDAYQSALGGVNVDGRMVKPTFEAWASAAAVVVAEGIEAARVLPDGTLREINATAKNSTTWEQVLKVALRERLISG